MQNQDSRRHGAPYAYEASWRGVAAAHRGRALAPHLRLPRAGITTAGVRLSGINALNICTPHDDNRSGIFKQHRAIAALHGSDVFPGTPSSNRFHHRHRDFQRHG